MVGLIRLLVVQGHDWPGVAAGSVCSGAPPVPLEERARVTETGDVGGHDRGDSPPERPVKPRPPLPERLLGSRGCRLWGTTDRPVERGLVRVAVRTPAKPQRTDPPASAGPVRHPRGCPEGAAPPVTPRGRIGPMDQKGDARTQASEMVIRPWRRAPSRCGRPLSDDLRRDTQWGGGGRAAPSCIGGSNGQSLSAARRLKQRHCDSALQRRRLLGPTASFGAGRSSSTSGHTSPRDYGPIFAQIRPTYSPRGADD